MAYGDLSLDAPEKPNKGHEGGACNRRACQAEPALWWNHGSHSWYCADCARDIGQDPVNKRDWELRHRPECGHPMFETREEMDARKAESADYSEVEARAYVLGQGRLYFPALKPPRQQGKTDAMERRYHVVVPYPGENRQQRRARERAARKGR